MHKIKDYFIYFTSFLFTIIGVYLFINSFVNNEFSKTNDELFKERFINLAGVLFFGPIGFVIYFTKKYPHETNKPKLFALLFSCLGFVISSLVLVIYPESFKKGPKLMKYIIGIIGLVFFGLGFFISLAKLIKYKKRLSK